MTTKLKSPFKEMYENYLLSKENDNSKMISEQYKWQQSKYPFERTYRRMSNLDDRYENGVHDLMKFIKFGLYWFMVHIWIMKQEII